ncbi:Ankyrin-2 [Triplophysa tibetana]|uniref:Ankyrin-2 n=1 Tax=Triplophysa tibetana TaxID=1572043 RepID=A0A5A9PL00_9TELE|nr:Ankyrin-2 [Triplophysa tibetana]
MEDYDGSESTEMSMLHIIHDPATLASPDLLSEVSDMKQDLIKMSVLLTSEKSEQSFSTAAGQRSDKAGKEEVDEPFVIVEKVKEDLEKVEEILREGTMEETIKGGAAGKSAIIEDEEWVLLSDTDVEDYKSKNITKVQETLFQEVRIKQDIKLSSPPKRDMSAMVSHLSRDLEYCVQEKTVQVRQPQELDIVKETFKEVILTHGSKSYPAKIKKPARKKRKDREFASGSSEDDLERMSRSQSEESLDEDAVIGESAPVFGSLPVSPKIVETPIGSIKDRVKALQKKVEEEEDVEKWKPQKVNTSQSKLYVAETEKSSKPPKSPKSPKSQTERLEETMSVKELMKAFQTGQDPSKNMSGLFEHKAITTVTTETVSSVVNQANDNQMTGRTQDSEDKSVVENKILKESHCMDPDTIQHEPTIMNRLTPLMTVDRAWSSQNKASDQAVNPNIIFNFEDDSPSENLSEKKTMDQCEESEEQQITSNILEDVDPGLIPEKLHYNYSTCQNRRLSVEPQISPDRKPSEDFSADIKAELEDNAEYQLFRQTTREADNHYLICSDDTSLEDGEQMHQAAMESYSYNLETSTELSTAVVQGETLLQSEKYDDKLDESPDSDKHEALADSPGNSVGIRTPHSSTVDSDKHEGVAETPQTSPKIHVLHTTTVADIFQGTDEAQSITHQKIWVTSYEKAESDISEQILTVTSKERKFESPSLDDSRIDSPCPYTKTESTPLDDSNIDSFVPSTRTESPSPNTSKIDSSGPFTGTWISSPDDFRIDSLVPSTRTDLPSPDDSKIVSLVTTSTRTVLPSPDDSKINSLIPYSRTELLSPDDSKIDSLVPSTRTVLKWPDDSKIDSLVTSTRTELPSPEYSKIDLLFPSTRTELPSPEDSKMDSLVTSTRTELLSPDDSKIDSLVPSTRTVLKWPDDSKIDLLFPSTRTELQSPEDSKMDSLVTSTRTELPSPEDSKIDSLFPSTRTELPSPDDSKIDSLVRSTRTELPRLEDSKIHSLLPSTRTELPSPDDSKTCSLVQSTRTELPCPDDSMNDSLVTFTQTELPPLEDFKIDSIVPSTRTELRSPDDSKIFSLVPSTRTVLPSPDDSKTCLLVRSNRTDLQCPNDSKIDSPVTSIRTELPPLDDSKNESLVPSTRTELPSPDDTEIDSLITSTRTELPSPDDSKIDSLATSTRTELPSPDDSKIDSLVASTRTELPSPDDFKIDSLVTSTRTELPSPEDSKIDSVVPPIRTELPSPDDSKNDSLVPSTRTEFPSPDDSKVDSLVPFTRTGLPSPDDSKIDSLGPSTQTESPSPEDSKIDSHVPSTRTELPFPEDSKIDSLVPSIQTELPSPDDSNFDSHVPSTRTEISSPDDSKIIIQETMQVMQFSHVKSNEPTTHHMESDSACRESKIPIDSYTITKKYEEVLQYSLHSEDAPIRPFNLDSLQPKTTSDATVLCQTDSLETSPVREDESSHKSPDSIEPSPTNESPCPDSLEGSPTGQGYIERDFSTCPTSISDSQVNAEKEVIFKESESFQILESPDVKCLSMYPKEIRDHEDLDDTIALQRQFTPEEEMFKMAAKIKTFDEMEKEAKKKKVKFDFDCTFIQPEELSPHKSPLDFNTVLTNESQEQRQESLTDSDSHGAVLPSFSSLSDDDNDSSNLAESPYKVSVETDPVLETTDKGVQDHSQLEIVDLQPCKDIAFVQADIEDEEEDYEQVHSVYHSIVVSETYTADRTEQDVVKSQLQSKVDIEISDIDTESPNESKTFERIVEPVSPTDTVCTSAAIKEQNDTQPDACLYEEDQKEMLQEIPESVLRDLVPWSAQLDDDDAFDAKIEAEEKKILALCSDRRSTSDTTPGRTPTEEGTPNPFLFQEGKFFEMTRGGAIDMTKRTMEDEAVFFPVYEDLTEDGFEQVTFNTSEFDSVASFEGPVDGLLHQDSIADDSSAFESETRTEDVQVCLVQSEFQSEPECPTDNNLYEGTPIPNINTATSTVTRTVHSEQDPESSDSSVEDEQHSVVEMPIFTREYVVCVSETFSATSKEIVTEIVEATPKPKLEVKAASFDHILGKGDSTEQNQRPKSEADIDNAEWSMYIAEGNIDKLKPKIFSSRLPYTQEHDDDLHHLSEQPESPSKCPQEVELLTEFEKGAQASIDLESSLKTVRPPSIGEDVIETRPNWEDSVETQMQRISDSSSPDQCKELAKELEFIEDEIQQVRTDNPNSLQEQSHALLQRWVEREGKHATDYVCVSNSVEDTLIKRLTKINRMDIVHLIEIQMHKSVQEQTSRTYAEIERTLDHSEVQEDAESMRVVRRVETSQRHPPAVSEEDLSVASLLDIPSWAEAMGNAHSESIHGDLMEELEIIQDNFINEWPSQELKKESTNEAAEVSSSEEEKQAQCQLSDHENSIPSPSPVGLSSLSELHQQSTESSQNVFDFSQVSIARYSSGENSVVVSMVEPDHIVPDLLKHTSPDSEVEESPLHEPKRMDEISVGMDQVSPVYEKSDLESNEKTELFKSSETSDTPEPSPCHESKPSESVRLVPESSQMSGQDKNCSFSLHGFASTIKEAGDTFLYRTEMTQEVSRVTPDLIKSSPESVQGFVTTEKFSDLDTASLQSYEAEHQDVVETSPTIDSGSRQSSPHNEIIPLNEDQCETISFSPQPSETILIKVDFMIEQQIESHELEVSYLQLLDCPGQQIESFGEYCNDLEDKYCPEQEHEELELTHEPLKEDTHVFRKELPSQSETDSDTWIQPEKAQLSEKSPLLSSDISPQTPETVITCQHFDFGEQSSEFRSASIEKAVSEDSQSSKRPQSESFKSFATFQHLDKHFGRSLSESSQPLVNMNPAFEEPVSQERIFSEEQYFDQSLFESSEPLELSLNINSVLEEPVSHDDVGKSTQHLEEKHVGCLSWSSEHLEDSLNKKPVHKEPSQDLIVESPLSQVDNSNVTISKSSKRSSVSSTTKQSEEKHSGRCLSKSSEPMVPSLPRPNNLVFEELQETAQAENPLADKPVISKVDLLPVLGVESEKHHLDVSQGEQHSVIENPSKESPEDTIFRLELTESKELEVGTEIHSTTDIPKPYKDLTPKPKDLQSVDQHDDSDLETFFDCKQNVSDNSEQEEDEPSKHTIALSNKVMKSNFFELKQLDDRSSSAYVPSDKSPHWSVKSSDGEDFEETVIIHEPNEHPHEKDVYITSQGGNLDSSLQTAQELPLRGGAEYNDDDDFGLRREIDEALGVLSNSSDDDMLTTRVVRRRVIIQGDDVPDIPPQSVTEEQYTDAQGNLVVKKVTRKVIRRCVSSDGVEKEQVRVEGSEQQPVIVEQGDGYSRVMKRTVLKSEGHQTEVTFHERAGMSSLKEESAGGQEVTQVVQTTVVHGERLEKHEGDSVFAADLPSARDDFTQALGYLEGFRKVSIPHVIEQEIQQPDGSVVRRTRMKKSRTRRRSTVRDAGGQQRVCAEQIGDRSEHHDNLQHHLHQFIHHYCAQNDREEEWEDAEKMT